MEYRYNEEKPIYTLSDSASHAAILYCFTSIVRKAEHQLIKSEDKKQIPTKYTVCVTCKYFLKRKMKFSDFQDTLSLQFILSNKLTKKNQICQLCKTLGLWFIVSIWGPTIWMVKWLEKSKVKMLGKIRWTSMKIWLMASYSLNTETLHKKQQDTT